MNAQQFAINAHASTNHMYDTYLPYEFHLRMVVHVAEQFKHLLDPSLVEDAISACWLHDTIEDARCNYNDVLKASNKNVAEMVRACTNYGRGRNRKERMPDECYEDIKTTGSAIFVKLCDRIANVQYSKMTGSRMFEMYQSEQLAFQSKLYTRLHLQEMWDYLATILKP